MTFQKQILTVVDKKEADLQIKRATGRYVKFTGVVYS